jgi:hypothetical protein
MRFDRLSYKRKESTPSSLLKGVSVMSRELSYYQSGFIEGIIQAIQLIDERRSGREVREQVKYVLSRMGKEDIEIQEMLQE